MNGLETACMACPVCNSIDIYKKYDLFDDRYAYPGFYMVYICSNCGHGMVDHVPADRELEIMYTEYYPRISYELDQHGPRVTDQRSLMTWLNGEYANAYRWVPEKVRVLDIGCGLGEALGYHEARGCEAWGTEADRNADRAAERFGYRINIGIFNHDDYPKKYFDYVTLDQVMEHIREPQANLSDISKILKPGGYIVLSTPNYRGLSARIFRRKWLHWHVPYHLHYFTRESMDRLAHTTGFELVTCRTITNSAWLYMQLIHLFTCPAQGEVSTFWRDHKNLAYVNMRRPIIRLVRFLYRTRVIHVVNRLMDMLGMGDNFVMVLRKGSSS